MKAIKQVSINREVKHTKGLYGYKNAHFSESHEDFVDRVTKEINNLDVRKLISVNYVKLSTSSDNYACDEEVAVIRRAP